MCKERGLVARSFVRRAEFPSETSRECPVARYCGRAGKGRQEGGRRERRRCPRAVPRSVVDLLPSPLHGMIPLDNLFHFEPLQIISDDPPPSPSLPPFFKLDARNNHHFHLPLIQQPVDAADFQDPIFAGLELLRLPWVLREEDGVKEVEHLDAFQELAVEEETQEEEEEKEPRDLWQEALEVKEIKLVRLWWWPRGWRADCGGA